MNLQLPPDRPLPDGDRMAEAILHGGREQERTTAGFRRGPWLVAAAAAVLAGVVVGVLVIDRGSLGQGPVALPPTVTTSVRPTTVTPTPSPASTPSPSPTPSSPSASGVPARKVLALGETAVFEHFEVTVTRANAYVDRSTVRAKVCVRSLPPDPTGDTTRVSIDPWLVVAGPGQLPARAPRQPSPTDYPVETYLRVGECVEGGVEFAAPPPGTRLREVRYQNFLGDRARWTVPR